MEDAVGISKETTKQDELFDYGVASNYLKGRVRNYMMNINTIKSILL